ncbi:MAG: hypothetical protein ACOH19_16915 [Rhodoglobus sp.]
MNKTDRSALLSSWIKPSSDNEKDKQERATRMVQEGISAHAALDGASYKIYAKGSYRNNTNVRRDSDVDIVVELQECFYYEFAPGVTRPTPTVSPYSGGWTRESWRAEVLGALQRKFPGEVDASGKIAINIAEKPGSRPSIDVVPSYQYRWFTDASMTLYATGSTVWTTDMTQVVNWPQQQFDNGVAKNTATGSRYKNFVRVLKHAENTLAADGKIDEMPSYFMECLIYNVDNLVLQSGDLDAGFKATLADLYARLNAEPDSRMVEPNDIKYLFRASQKWTTEMGRKLVEQTWSYLGYGDDNG